MSASQIFSGWILNTKLVTPKFCVELQITFLGSFGFVKIKQDLFGKILHYLEVYFP